LAGTGRSARELGTLGALLDAVDRDFGVRERRSCMYIGIGTVLLVLLIVLLVMLLTGRSA